MKTTLTPWAEAKIRKRTTKSSNWLVNPISSTRFQVVDFLRDAIVDFAESTCSCRKWQLSGIPCGHLIRVLNSLNHGDCTGWVHNAYHVVFYRKTYESIINPLPNPCNWETPDDLIFVRPPVMDRRLPGRPRNMDRIPSQGEGPIIKECSRCHQRGHTRTTCPALVPTRKPEGSGKRRGSDNKGKTSLRGDSSSMSQSEAVYPTVDLN